VLFDYEIKKKSWCKKTREYDTKYLLKTINENIKSKPFQDKLLGWYNDHARILPWRDNPSPYRVWISEIMLQQTRVDTVKPYFENFTNEVGTVEELAGISIDKLLKLWEGLGYYSRALNLKKAANILIDKFDGQLPSDTEKLKSLPGVGSYTSGAIASIAFNKRVSAIDGNVLRVIARVTANGGDISSPIVKKEIEYFVNQILPLKRVGDFNQALMELGATICLPNGLPKCEQCPVESLCESCQKGFTAEIPFKSKKKARKIELKTILLIRYKECFAIRQRAEAGLLSNLWELANFEGHLSVEACQDELKRLGILADKITPLKSSKHIFTHLEWHMIGYFVKAESVNDNSELTWATAKQIKKQYSIPTAFKEYTAFLREGCKETEA
jgi:A/G-specific adenine glycosylase